MRAIVVARAACLSVALAAAAVLAGCVTTREVSDERFVRFFDELAFGSAVDGERKDRLVRWEGPLRFSVHGDAAFGELAVRTIVEVARMAAIPGPPILAGDAPIVLDQEPAGTLFPVNRDRVDCYVHFKRRGAVITGAEIHIAAAEPRRVELCLYHEFFHALGLGHSGVIASVMSPFHSVEAPTRWDVMAVRFLMSGKLKAGMPRQQVLAILRGELGSLRAWPDTLKSGDAGLGDTTGRSVS